MTKLKQKLFLTSNVLNTKRRTFFGLGKYKTVKTENVFKVEKAINFRAKSFYYPAEVDELLEMGVEIEISE